MNDTESNSTAPRRLPRSMMNRTACIALAVFALGLAARAPACVTWFDSLSAWQTATTDGVVAVTFNEPVWPINTPLKGTWSVGGIEFTGYAGTPFPNIFVASFGSPFGTGNWMVANGDENIDIVPTTPTTAFAFDAASNGFGPATVRVFDQDDELIGTQVIAVSTTRFVGITAPVPIARVNFSSVLGALADTGFDTVRLATRVGAHADLNSDGIVDGADLAMLLGQWGPCQECTVDLNCDGIIDGADLAALLGNWGS